MKFVVAPADIHLVRTFTPLGEAIRWWEKVTGDDAIFNHAAIAVDRFHIAEAVGKITLTPAKYYYHLAEKGDVTLAVFRPKFLSDKEKIFIGRLPAINRWYGKPNGVLRFAALGIDKLLGTHFAKYHWGDMVCSSLVARCYAGYYDKWGDWREVTPDDIADTIINDENNWEVIYG